MTEDLTGLNAAPEKGQENQVIRITGKVSPEGTGSGCCPAGADIVVDKQPTVGEVAQFAGGEDTRFIARRIAICAAEDVGNADPTATMLAAAAVQISEFVGLPEAQLALAQAAIYIACAPKSNASAMAVWQAMKDVKDEPTRRVPPHLKDAHYAAAKKTGIGIGYKYPHDYEHGFVQQEYLPGSARRYYVPKEAGYEKDMGHYLQKLQMLIDSKKSGREDSDV